MSSRVNLLRYLEDYLPSVAFALEDAKQAILDAIIYPVKRPDFFPLGWPRGIMLFGPPGCGKTLLAAATATEIEAAFYCIDSATIMSARVYQLTGNPVMVGLDPRLEQLPAAVRGDLFGLAAECPADLPAEYLQKHLAGLRPIAPRQAIQ